MVSDALGDRAPTEAELDVAYKLASDANCKSAIYWQNYIHTGDHQGIFEPLSKLAIELTKALVRTPRVADWLIVCNCTKEPQLEIGGRECSTAHHAALECVCRVVNGVISETRPNPVRKFDRRCLLGWDWEKLEKRITRECRRAIEALPEEVQGQREDSSYLNLKVDDVRQELSRKGKHKPVRIAGPVVWPMFNLLYKAKGAALSRAQLRKLDENSPSAKRTAKGRLNSKLKTLAVVITEDWRLVDVSQA